MASSVPNTRLALSLLSSTGVGSRCSRFAGIGLGLGLGLTLGLLDSAAFAQVRGMPGGRSLGSVINGVRDGSCAAGLCRVSGGTPSERNLFHRLGAFDTRGGITGVRIESEGFRNVILGVTSPLGSYIDKVVALSSKGNLFMMSPGGITVAPGGGFQNIQHLQLSTATGLRLGEQLFNALATTADQVAGLSREPQRGAWGQFTDPGTLAELGLQMNGDLRLDGGTLTVEQSLLLDAQGGNVVLQAAGIKAQGPDASIALSADSIQISNSRLDASSAVGPGGTISLTSNTIAIASSVLDAGGATAGGAIALSGRDRVQLSGSDVLARGGGGSSVMLQEEPSPSPVTPLPATVEAQAGSPEAGTTTVTSQPADSLGSDAPAPVPAPRADLRASGELSAAVAPAVGGQVAVQAGLLQISGGRLDVSGTDGSGRTAAPAGESGAWLLSNADQPATSAETRPLADAASGRGGVINLQADRLLQGGAINAAGTSGGVVTIQAQELVSGAPITATGLAGAGGSITLRATDAIWQTTASILEASGLASGGTIQLQAGSDLLSSATFRAAGEGALANGGLIELSAAGNVTLTAARLDASGIADGGTIHVGGGFQGAPLSSGAPNAAQVRINGYTGLKANAGLVGDGGEVVVWSDLATTYYGWAEARGGSQSGQGGLIEVSGRDSLVFGGMADASAPAGRQGSLLLDPKNIIIDSSGVGGFSYNIQNILAPGTDAQAGLIELFLNDSRILVNDVNGAQGAGSAYFFDGASNALLATLDGTGAFSEADTILGSGLAANKLFLFTPQADVGAVADAGAVTWIDLNPVGATSPTVTFANGLNVASISVSTSLLGSHTGDFQNYVLDEGYVGYQAGSIYNYLVLTPKWDNGSVLDAGAATWIEGATGKLSAPLSAVAAVTGGVIGSTQSLVGASTGDFDNVYIRDLASTANYNRMILLPGWDAGSSSLDAGAVTWMNASTGLLSNGAAGGPVGTSNSLLQTGSAAYNRTYTSGGVQVVDNGSQYYTIKDDFTQGYGSVMIYSGAWDASPLVPDAGALTWMNGRTGALVDGSSGGTISAGNSLVGSTSGDLLPSYNASAPSYNDPYYFNSTGYLYSLQVPGATGTAPTSPLSTVLIGLPNWDNGPAVDAGAAVWLNLVDGANPHSPVATARLADGALAFRAIGPSVALVGTSSNDAVGANSQTVRLGSSSSVSSNVAARLLLTNPDWDNPSPTSTPTSPAVDAGSVTWLNPVTGALADGSPALGGIGNLNSLVGTSTDDRIGAGYLTFSPGNNYYSSTPSNVFLLASDWDHGTVVDAGAVVWIKGADGSLASDLDATSPTRWAFGDVSIANALVGGSAGDAVGSGYRQLLANSGSAVGNLLVTTSGWDNGAAQDAGAVTWISGETGRLSNGVAAHGSISAANSLVGVSTSDSVGSQLITTQDYPYYNQYTYYSIPDIILKIGQWDNGSIQDAGALTWLDGATGLLANGQPGVGQISGQNSLVGSNSSDLQGSSIINLGNYYSAATVALLAPAWDASGGAVDAGSFTWIDFGTGQLANGSPAVGVLGATTSLVGESADDAIGSNYTSYNSSSYSPSNLALISPGWDNRASTAIAVNAGALTWVNGASGRLADGSPAIGAVSASNSLVGGSTGDSVSAERFQYGAGLLLRMPAWDEVVIGNQPSVKVDVGAAAWINLDTGRLSDGAAAIGLVSSTNSLTGSTAGDQIGLNYLSSYYGTGAFLGSPGWDASLTATDAGAFTWLRLDTGRLSNGLSLLGRLSAANSLIGSSSGDQVGRFTSQSGGVTEAYLQSSPLNSTYWLLGTPDLDANGVADAGSVTWFNSDTGTLATGGFIQGEIGAANSLLGATTSERFGVLQISGPNPLDLTLAANNGVLLLSPGYDNGAAVDAGALAWMNASTGALADGAFGGILGASQALLGTTTGDLNQVSISNSSGNTIAFFPEWHRTTATDASAIGTPVGAVAWINGATGTLANDSAGGLIGDVALRGASTGDFTDYSIEFLGGNGMVFTPNWDLDPLAIDAGAVTWIRMSDGTFVNSGSTTPASSGEIGPQVSLVGAHTGDFTAYDWQPLTSSTALLITPGWDSASSVDAGAATWMNSATGRLAGTDIVLAGPIGPERSLVGQSQGDFAGYALASSASNTLLFTPGWDQSGAQDAGAATWINAATGLFSDGTAAGGIGLTRSLLGSSTGDFSRAYVAGVGSNQLVVTPAWDQGSVKDAGAVTWLNTASGVLSDLATGGVIGASHSLLGANTGDFDNLYIRPLNGGKVLLSTPRWGGGQTSDLGALTWLDPSSGALADASFGGSISELNSLLGTRFNPNNTTDQYYAINEFSPGNGVNSLLIYSQYWNSSFTSTSAADAGAGALTWMNALNGKLVDGSSGGLIGPSNSLVGSNPADLRPSRDTYYQYCYYGCYGPFEKSQIFGEFNLIRSAAGDNALVVSPYFDAGQVPDVGALAWINMTTGLLGDGRTRAAGVLGSTNGLLGTSASEQLGSRYLGLSPDFLDSDSRAGNGYGSNPIPTVDHVLFRTTGWDSPSGAQDAGALTWLNLRSGALANGAPVQGVLGSANSLVGSSSGDGLGSVYSLHNGTGGTNPWNLVLATASWDNGAAQDAGAITWLQGSTGQLANGQAAVGSLSVQNSLVGLSTNDAIGSNSRLLGQVSSYYQYPSGQTTYSPNIAFASSSWDNGGAVDAGAVVWINAVNGLLANGSPATGAINAQTALVGSTAGDRVGAAIEDVGYSYSPSGVNLVIFSGDWDNGSLVDAGAVSWLNGGTGQLMNGAAAIGAVSADFSIVGTNAGDRVGGNYLSFGTTTSSGAGAASSSYGRNLLLISPDWDHGPISNAGAVTWLSGSTGLMVDDSGTGILSASNSLVGNSANDRIGSSVVKLSSDFSTSPNAFLVNGPGLTPADTGNPLAVQNENRVAQRVTIASRSPLSFLPDTSAPSSSPNALLFGTEPGFNVTLLPSAITSVMQTGTSVLLQATNDIFLRSDSAVTVPFLTNGATVAGGLTLQAGRTITLNSNISTLGGDLTLLANDSAVALDPNLASKRDAGNGSILQRTGTTIDAGSGAVTMRVGTTTGASTAGTISLANVRAGSIDVEGPAIGLSGASLVATSPTAQPSIRLSASNLSLASSRLDASSSSGDAGSIQLDGATITLGGSQLLASSSFVGTSTPSGLGGSIQLGLNSQVLNPLLSINSSSLYANGVLDGGLVSLDGQLINLSGGEINTSATGTDPLATGGFIRIGSYTDPQGVTVGYLPDVVNLTNARLIADPPSIGGQISINGVTVNITQSLLNVFGSTGGNLAVGSPSTTTLAFNGGSSQLLGSSTGSYTLQGSTIFGFTGLILPANATVTTIGQLYVPPLPVSPVTPQPVSPVTPTAPTTPATTNPVVSPTTTSLALEPLLTLLASPLTEATLSLSLTQQPLDAQQTTQDYVSISSGLGTLTDAMTFDQVVALSLDTGGFILVEDMAARPIFEFDVSISGLNYPRAEFFPSANPDLAIAVNSSSSPSDLLFEDNQLAKLLAVVSPGDLESLLYALKRGYDVIGLMTVNPLSQRLERIRFFELSTSVSSLSKQDAERAFMRGEQAAQSHVAAKLLLSHDGKVTSVSPEQLRQILLVVRDQIRSQGQLINAAPAKP